MTSLNLVIQIPQPLQLIVQPPAEIKSTLTVGQGPSGPRGLPGVSGNSSYNYPCLENMSGHRAVILDSSGTKVIYASSDTLSHGNAVIGISTNAAIANDNVMVIRDGAMMEPSWTWIPDQAVYLGLDGVLTQTPPSYPSDLFLLVIGFSVNPTTLFIKIGEPIILS